MAKVSRELTELMELLPAGLWGMPQAATRYLYGSDRPGRVTVFFQNHEVLRREGDIVIRAVPAELDRDRSFKSREDARVYGFNFLLRGRLKVRADAGVQREIAAGQAFQVLEKSMEQLEIRPGPGCVECGLSVDGELGRQLVGLGLWQPREEPFEPGHPRRLVQALHELFEQLLDPRSNIPSIFGGIARVLEENWQGDEALTGDEGQAGFRRRACALLAAHCGPRERLPELAERLGMNYATFRRRFRREVGLSPAQYQLQRRMENARILLRTLSVQETAERLGYADPFVFSRQFRKSQGYPPSRGKMG